mgnify:CR=1 FL=1
MGRGDKKTKRGKISAGSFGKSRPKKERNRIASSPTATPAAQVKKATKPSKDEEE